MIANKLRLPTSPAYRFALLAQAPIWLAAGLVWGALMMKFDHWPLIAAVVMGLIWGVLMWAVAGNLLAAGFVLRRSVTLPVHDLDSFKQAVHRASSKLNLIVLTESPEAISLGPRRVLIRSQVQETQVKFGNGHVTISAPMLTFWAVKRAFSRALSPDLKPTDP